VAIAIAGTISEHVSPAATAVGNVDGNHTTASDTSLLLNLVAIEAHEAPEDATPSRFDISDTNQTLTLIGDTGYTGSSSDVRLLAYGLVSPGAVVDANCRFDVEFDADQIASIWINFSGTITSSVAAATNYENEKVNVAATSTTVIPEGGSTGNPLICWAAANGNDMAPSSVNNSFTELLDNVTAATTADYAYHLSMLSGGPSAATVTWNTTDENSGILIELVPATSTNLLPDYSGQRGVMRGVGRGT